MKLVTWSLGHSVTRSGHLVIRSSGHPIIQSSSHPVIQCSCHPVIFNITTNRRTDGRTNNIRTSRSASQTNSSSIRILAALLMIFASLTQHPALAVVWCLCQGREGLLISTAIYCYLLMISTAIYWALPCCQHRNLNLAQTFFIRSYIQIFRPRYSDQTLFIGGVYRFYHNFLRFIELLIPSYFMWCGSNVGCWLLACHHLEIRGEGIMECYHLINTQIHTS